MRTVALDLGKHAIDWCEVKNGLVTARGRAPSLEHLQEVLGPAAGRAVVGFEACRESCHVHDVMVSWGHEVRVFDTTRVRALAGIGDHGRKNDRIDAQKLAIALERDVASYAHVLGEDARKLRELQEMHRALVGTRKRLITNVRGILQGRGVRLPSCAAEDFVEMVRGAQLTDELMMLVQPMLVPLVAIEPELAKVDLRMHELCAAQRDPVIERLASVPGVSLQAAAAFISVVDDPSRFNNAAQVSSYLGLCPSENTTGGRRKLGSITKQGNAHARMMLVQCAWCVIRSRNGDDALVRWAHRTAQRRGRMRAAVAVARRLARLLWALWRDGCYYDPHMPNASTPTRDAAQQELSQKRGALKLARLNRQNQRTASSEVSMS